MYQPGFKEGYNYVIALVRKENSGILKAVHTMDPAGCYRKDTIYLNFYCPLPLVIILKMWDTKVKQLKIYNTT